MVLHFDTEFHAEGEVLRLISIGVAGEDGREFYAVNRDYDWNTSNDWLKANVMPKLDYTKCEGCDNIYMSRDEIKQALVDFTADIEAVEWMADHCAYDFTALYQLYEGFRDKPKNWPKFCYDLKWYELMAGDPPDFPPKDEKGEHNALVDCRWSKRRYEYIATLLEGVIHA